jgi:2-oxo-4-hydroxy-4-carboxy-5-ureidoimidazoline decarboxylase
LRHPNDRRAAGNTAAWRDYCTIDRIPVLNATYKKKFGFPFIIAVRMHTKEGILFEFNRRLQNDTQTEFANDLQNVYVITRLRLNKLLEAS